MSKCPSCFKEIDNVIFQQLDSPVHSVLLFQSEEEALSVARGEIELHHCLFCDLIWNEAFDLSKMSYGEGYEETQGYSVVFSKFQESLAEDLIKRHNLYNKKVCEIGCGKGEFLKLFCELGGNDCLGFDPSFEKERFSLPQKGEMSVVEDFFDGSQSLKGIDFVICKMTLEHIPNVSEFLSAVSSSMSEGATLFIQVPNGDYVISDSAFWDVYYEHCNYFTKEALSNALQLAGFELKQLKTDFGDQYLFAEAVLSLKQTNLLTNKTIVSEGFSKNAISWREKISNQEVILWGGGSKAVAFIKSLETPNEIMGAIDINPYRQGTFLAGTSLSIFSPDIIRRHPKATVVIMNPKYEQEVKADLLNLGHYGRVVALEKL